VFNDDGGVGVEKRLTAAAGRGHVAVVEQFVETICAGDWRAHDGAAADLARVVDACYRSASEQREVRV
jgi:hypothetical protein